MTTDYFRVGTQLSYMARLRLSSCKFVNRQGDLYVTWMDFPQQQMCSNLIKKTR